MTAETKLSSRTTMVFVVFWYRLKNTLLFPSSASCHVKLRKGGGEGVKLFYYLSATQSRFCPHELFQRSMDTASAEDSLINTFNHADLQHSTKFTCRWLLWAFLFCPQEYLKKKKIIKFLCLYVIILCNKVAYEHCAFTEPHKLLMKLLKTKLTKPFHFWWFT